MKPCNHTTNHTKLVASSTPAILHPTPHTLPLLPLSLCLYLSSVCCCPGSLPVFHSPYSDEAPRKASTVGEKEG